MNINQINDIIEKGLMHKAHAKILQKVLEYKKDNKSNAKILDTMKGD